MANRQAADVPFVLPHGVGVEAWRDASPEQRGRLQQAQHEEGEAGRGVARPAWLVGVGARRATLRVVLTLCAAPLRATQQAGTGQS